MNLILSYIDLDVDDVYVNSLLKIMIEDKRLLREYFKLLLSRLSSLTPRQQLRVLDYILYISNKNEMGLTSLKIQCSPREVVYSITLLSLNPRIVSLYKALKICDKKLEILNKFINNLEDIILNPKLIDFLREKINGEGFDKAHLELLILLEFALKLRNEGYHVELNDFYGDLLLDTNASFEEQMKIRDQIIEEYKKKYDVDVSAEVGDVFGMVDSVDKIKEYMRKVLDVGGGRKQSI